MLWLSVFILGSPLCSVAHGDCDDPPEHCGVPECDADFLAVDSVCQMWNYYLSHEMGVKPELGKPSPL